MHTIEEINSNPIFQPPAEMLEYFEFFDIDCDELEFPNLIIEETTSKETVKYIKNNLKIHHTYKTVSKNKRLKKLLDEFENECYDEYTKLSLVFWGSNKSKWYGIRENKIRLKEVIIEYYTATPVH